MMKWLITIVGVAALSITSPAHAGDKELVAYRQQKKEYAQCVKKEGASSNRCVELSDFDWDPSELRPTPKRGSAKAGQPTIPAKYRGEWCKTGGYYSQRKYVPPSECDIEYVIRLTARSIEFEDGACKLARISKVNLPEGLFTCDGEPIPFEFATGNGPLGHLARRLYLKQEEQEEPAVPAAPPQSSSAYQCPTTLPICTVGKR
jgi:hypothetical protein